MNESHGWWSGPRVVAATVLAAAVSAPVALSVAFERSGEEDVAWLATARAVERDLVADAERRSASDRCENGFGSGCPDALGGSTWFVLGTAAAVDHVNSVAAEHGLVTDCVTMSRDRVRQLTAEPTGHDGEYGGAVCNLALDGDRYGYVAIEGIEPGYSTTDYVLGPQGSFLALDAPAEAP